jgi:hypothetical protein
VPDLRIKLPWPHPAQQQILAEARRFNVADLGRRTGKSTLAQHLLVQTTLTGQPAAYLAPTYRLLAEFWRTLVSTLAPITRRKLEGEYRLELVTGGVIECWSLDGPDPARGRKYARLIVDEAAMVLGLLSIWNLALRPTLMDLGGDAWFLSTPKGLNDFYTLYQRGQDPLEADWQSWQMPTAANPFIQPQEIEAARLSMPEREYSQEILAVFLNLTGLGVFRGVDAVARLQPEPPQPGHQYVMGVDWGRSGDFTVFSIFDATLMQQVALDRMTEISYDLQVGRLYRWVDLYHPRLIVAEANSMGGPLVERLQRGYQPLVGKPQPALPVYGWTATNATKGAAVESLALAIENGAITLLDDPVQAGELKAFESSRTQTGMVRYSAPDGLHDDTVTGLYLAHLGAAQAPASTTTRYAWAR